MPWCFYVKGDRPPTIVPIAIIRIASISLKIKKNSIISCKILNFNLNHMHLKYTHFMWNRRKKKHNNIIQNILFQPTGWTRIDRSNFVVRKKKKRKTISHKKVCAKTNSRRCRWRWVCTTSDHTLTHSLTSPTGHHSTTWLCRSDINHYTLDKYAAIDRNYGAIAESGCRPAQIYAER